MSSHINWNWQAENVQTEIQNGEYVSSESTLLLAGPSRLSMLAGNSAGLAGSTNSLIPMGLIQNFSVTQNRQVTKLFEIGSKRSYFVPGRLIANFTASRILFYGPSLLRLMYALAPDRVVGDLGSPLNIDPDSNGQGVAEIEEYSSLFSDSRLQNKPGYGGTADENNRDYWINLTSEVFSVPIGLAMIFKDARDRPYGAQYLEDVYIESHQMGVDSNSVVIAEAVSGQMDRVQPIQLATQTIVTA